DRRTRWTAARRRRRPRPALGRAGSPRCPQRRKRAGRPATSPRPGRPDPVEDRLGRADTREAAKASGGVDEGAHRADAAPAIGAVARVAVKAPPRARAQVPLDVVGEMLL